MSYGLISKDDRTISLKKVECKADVTNNFGIFTLKQSYYNDLEKEIDARYVFPIEQDIRIVNFSAKKNNHIISSDVKNSGECGGFFEWYVGELIPKEEVVIEITYTCSILVDNERTRIIIPTVISPRYVSCGGQIALESVLGRTLHTVSLDLVYRNSNITNVVSPTHDIIADIEADKVSVSFKNDSYSDRDVIIDVFVLQQDSPKIFYADNIISCSFSPEIDVYERCKREYFFMLDVSSSMAGEKLEQSKTALLVLLRALQKGDKFNVLVFRENCELFSDEFLPLNDDTLKVASKWIVSQTAEGNVELFKPIIEAYKNADNRAVLIITDGKISENSDIITYVKSHTGAVFYTFGIDCCYNQNVLSEFSLITGGVANFIKPTERIDDTIIKAFNIIASPSIKNAVVNFDVPVQNIKPAEIKRIHCGEKILVMAKAEDEIPKSLTVKGELENTNSIMQIDFDKVINGGSSLKYQYEATQIDSANMKPLFCHRDNLTRTKIDAHFINICKTQKASGRFMPKGSKSKENIGLHTAQILYEFCAECPNVDMYIWHLRKTVAFLLDYIENNNSAVIPKEIIEPLSIWHEVLGGNDEISQKVAVLRFLHREK